jgi:hypothetical protein
MGSNNNKDGTTTTNRAGSTLITITLQTPEERYSNDNKTDDIQTIFNTMIDSYQRI